MVWGPIVRTITENYCHCAVQRTSSKSSRCRRLKILNVCNLHNINLYTYYSYNENDDYTFNRNRLYARFYISLKFFFGMSIGADVCCVRQWSKNFFIPCLEFELDERILVVCFPRCLTILPIAIIDIQITFAECQIRWPRGIELTFLNLKHAKYIRWVCIDNDKR